MQLDFLPAPLMQDETGLWQCGKRSEISYPEHASALCLDVEENSFWFRHRNRCIVNTVRRFPAAGPIVDIGGGNGFVARALEEAGFATILLEPGIEGALAARRRGVANVICATFEDVGFAPGSVPNAGLFDVLEHLEDDFAALSHIHKTLVGGARLYITVPTYQWLFSAEDRFAGHFRRYTSRSLARLAARVGFEVEYSTYFFMPLPLPIFLFRTVPSWFGMLQTGSAEHIAAEHEATGLGRKLLARVPDREARLIDRGKRAMVGSSCIMVARKT